MNAVQVSGSDGLLGVERVVSMLRQRGYAVRDLRVDWTGERSSVWTMRCAVESGADPDLLVRRLQRAVSVLDARLDHRAAPLGAVS
ncbi:ACT domain-containing protein [Jatrophihabitans sp. YIM 134969]